MNTKDSNQRPDSSSSAGAAKDMLRKSTSIPTIQKDGPEPTCCTLSGSAGTATATPIQTPAGQLSTDFLKETGALLIRVYGAARDEGMTLPQVMLMMCMPCRYQDLARDGGCPQQNLYSVLMVMRGTDLVSQRPDGSFDLTRWGRGKFEAFLKKLGEISRL